MVDAESECRTGEERVVEHEAGGDETVVVEDTVVKRQVGQQDEDAEETVDSIEVSKLSETIVTGGFGNSRLGDGSAR